MSQMSSHLPLTTITTIQHNMGINSTQASGQSHVSANPTLGVGQQLAQSTVVATGTTPPVCCLIEDSQRCHRIAGNASYSKRIEKQVTQRKLRLTLDQRSHHSYICEHHKQMIQSIRSSNKRKRKDSDDDQNELAGADDQHIPPPSAATGTTTAAGVTGGQDVDLLALQVNTLRRYKKHYRIQTRPGLNKSQLAESLQRHFKSMPIYEKEAITYFIYMVKCNKNKLDQNSTGNPKTPALASD